MHWHFRFGDITMLVGEQRPCLKKATSDGSSRKTARVTWWHTVGQEIQLAGVSQIHRTTTIQIMLLLYLRQPEWSLVKENRRILRWLQVEQLLREYWRFLVHDERYRPTCPETKSCRGRFILKYQRRPNNFLLVIWRRGVLKTKDKPLRPCRLRQVKTRWWQEWFI